MIVVYVSGSFDLFHVGHLKRLERAKALGDQLIVGVNTDEFLESYKKKPIIPYEQRAYIIAGLKCVDAVIPHSSAAEPVLGDIRVVGPEWDCVTGLDLKLAVGKGQRAVVQPRTPGISTTEVIEKIKKEYCE